MAEQKSQTPVGDAEARRDAEAREALTRDCPRHGPGVRAYRHGVGYLRCALCQIERNTVWNSRNPERRREQARRQRELRPEATRATQKRSREKSRESRAAYRKAYYAAHAQEERAKRCDVSRRETTLKQALASPVLRAGFLLVTDARPAGERQWRACRTGQPLERGERIVCECLPAPGGWVVEPPRVGARREDERVRQAVGRWLQGRGGDTGAAVPVSVPHDERKVGGTP